MHHYIKNLNLKKISIFICIILIVIIYIYLSVRYSLFNFDDLSLNSNFLHGQNELKNIFLGLDIPNEYRTYSFSRILQLIIYNIFGNNPFPYFLIMAIFHVLSSFFIYKIISKLSKQTSLLNIEAFGCAIIWIFSPFSIYNTFHHFSYILFPFFIFLFYIYLFEKRLDNNKLNKKIWPLLVLVFVLSLSGEAMLLPIIIYLLIKINQKCELKSAIISLIILLSTIISHYLILDSFNNYSTSNFRFNIIFTNFNAIITNLSYFAESVKSAFIQGLQFTAISYEPYYPLLKSYSFAWNNLSPNFIFLSLCLLLLIITPIILSKLLINNNLLIYLKSYNYRFFSKIKEKSQSFREEIGTKNLVAITIILFSLWGLYLIMSLAGAKLYGYPFALQIRYGYVVIPSTLIVIFLWMRNIPRLNNQRILRLISWIIPFIVCISWLSYQFNVAPLNSQQNKKIISILNNAQKDGIKTISIIHKNFNNEKFFEKYRPFGITNPFIRLGDSPFQQDWTTNVYINSLGIKVEPRTYIDFDKNNILFFGNEIAPSILPKNQFMVIGSKSLGLEPINFPTDDIYEKKFKPGIYSDENNVDLLNKKIKFMNGINLVRLIKIDSKLIFKWSGPKSDDIVFVHFLDKNKKIISQGDYPYKDVLSIHDELNINNLIYVLPIQSKTWNNIYYVGIGLYKISSSNVTIMQKVLNGYRDWDEYRLIIPIK